MALQFGITYTNKGGGIKVQGDIKKVRQALNAKGEQPYVALLLPFTGNADWAWIENYRDRWSHRDPTRIEGFGIQFSSRRQFWQREGTAIKMGLGFNGDKPETNVDEMLTRGIASFNLLGQQLDTYTSLWEAATSHT